jgi:hypothetical protein
LPGVMLRKEIKKNALAMNGKGDDAPDDFY